MNDEQRERRNADRIGFFLIGCALGVAISTAISTAIQITQVSVCEANGGTATVVDHQVVCQERLQ